MEKKVWNRLSLPNFGMKTCFETVELALGRELLFLIQL